MFKGIKHSLNNFKLLSLNRGRHNIFSPPNKQTISLTTTCHGNPAAPLDLHSQTLVSSKVALGHALGHYRLHSAFGLHRGHLYYFGLFLRLLGGNVSSVCVRGSFTVEVIFSRQCLEGAAPNPSKVNDVLAAVENGGKYPRRTWRTGVYERGDSRNDILPN